MPPPISSSEIPDKWLLTVRNLVSLHEACIIRKHATLPRFETQDVNTRRWCQLMLYSSTFDFTSMEERDLAWDRMWALKADK